MLTSTTPSISLQPVTTCDAQALHMSAEISNETSSVSAAIVVAGARVARTGVSVGEPHATATVASKRKGAKRTFVIVRLTPRDAVRQE